MVSVLFVRPDSIYKQLGTDCWDIHRDARQWPGGNTIIAHPPCRAWGRLKHLAKPRPDEKELALFAVDQIRKWGGILEHPAGSSLWEAAELPAPGYVDRYGGHTVCVNQSWFGHRAEKKTLLYIVGIRPSRLPDFPISLDCPQYVIASSIKKGHPGYRPEVSKKEREATPLLFAQWLIKTAEAIEKLKQP